MVRMISRMTCRVGSETTTIAQPVATHAEWGCRVGQKEVANPANAKHSMNVVTAAGQQMTVKFATTETRVLETIHANEAFASA